MAITFAIFGLITSLAPSFLAGTLHERSHALACVALIVLSLLAFLPGFVSLPPMDRDEPRDAGE